MVTNSMDYVQVYSRVALQKWNSFELIWWSRIILTNSGKLTIKYIDIILQDVSKKKYWDHIIFPVL